MKYMAGSSGKDAIIDKKPCCWLKLWAMRRPLCTKAGFKGALLCRNAFY
jgi:hypothetical protein